MLKRTKIKCNRNQHPARLQADLSQNSSCVCDRIRCFGDGAAYDDVAGAGGDGFGGSDHANLISMPGARETNTRSYDDQVVSEFAAERGCVAAGVEYAVTVVCQDE